MYIFRRREGRKLLMMGLLCCSLIAALSEPTPAQLNQWGYWENGVTEPWWLSSDDFTNEDAVAAVARWKSADDVGQSLPGNDWSGVYFTGSDTHGTYVRWSPRGGFVMVGVDKCQARVMGLTYGRAEASPSLVQFFPEFDKAASHAHGRSHSPSPRRAALRFVPVEWRGQRMLVAEGAMDEFGHYVAGLGKYSYNRAFFYIGYDIFLTQRLAPKGGRQSETQPTGTEGTDRPAGAPVVPAAYARFLKQPIEATITAVGRRQVRSNYSYENPDGSGASYARASLTYVTVSAGRAHGLTANMFLRVMEPDEGDEVRIMRVGKNFSTGILIRSVDEAGGETFFDDETQQPQPSARVAVGWKLTTSPF